jgi:hypothetical protein
MTGSKTLSIKPKLTKDSVKFLETHSRSPNRIDYDEISIIASKRNCIYLIFIGDKIVPIEQRLRDKSVHDFMRKGNVYLTSSMKPNEVLRENRSISNERTSNRVKDPTLKLIAKESTVAAGCAMKNIHRTDDEEVHFKHPEHPEKLGAVLESDFFNKTKSSRRMRKDELTHDFSLAYGKTKFSQKLKSLIDTKKYHDSMTCKENKKTIEKQNFNYYKDGGIGKVNMNSLLNLDPNKITYDADSLKKDPLPMDYWKTNFELSQVGINNNAYNVI